MSERKSSRTPPKKTKIHIVFLGESQTGKSTFASFIVANSFGTNIFKSGDGSKSETSVVKREEFQFKIPNEYDIQNDGKIKETIYTIVAMDTPGLADTDYKDSDNIYEIIKILDDMNNSKTKVDLIILVIKFGDIISKETSEILRFYDKAFPDHMQSKLVVCFTHASDSEVKKYEKYNQPIATYIDKLGIEFAKVIRIKPYTYPIDNLPISDDDEKVMRNKRDSLLRLAINNNDKFDFKPYKFPKSPKWRQEDDSLIQSKNEGLIKLIEGTKILLESQIDNLNGEIDATFKKLQEVEAKMLTARSHLQIMDIDTPHQLPGFQLNDPWHVFWRSSDTFDIKTDYKITSVNHPGMLIDYTINEEKHIAGKVTQQWLYNLIGQITPYTEKRIYYANEIIEIKLELTRFEGEQKYRAQQTENLLKQLKYSQAEYGKIMNEIQKTKSEIELLHDDYITIDDARIRLIRR